MPRPGVKGQSQVTDIKHVRLIEYLRVIYVYGSNIH
jgi:hypothetical protein